MAKKLGSSEAIGVAFQSGDSPTAPIMYIKTTDISLDDMPTYVIDESTSKTIIKNADGTVEKIYGEKGFEALITADNLGFMFGLLFGAKGSPSQISNTGVYKHSFSLKNDNNHVAATLTRVGVVNRQFSKAVLNTLSLSFSTEGYAALTCDFMSNASGDHNVSFDVSKVDTSAKFVLDQIVVKLAANQSGLNSAASVKGVSLSLEANKNAQTHYVLGKGDKSPDDITNNQTDISGSLELFFEDATQRDKVLSGTHNAIRIEGSMGSGSSLRGFSIDLFDCILENFTEDYAVDGPIMSTVNFRASSSADPAKFMTGVVNNARSSY